MTRTGDPQNLRNAVRALGRRDPDLARARTEGGPLPDRGRPGGLATLLRILVQQQVSIASADAIWRRLSAVLDAPDAGALDPRRVLDQDDAALLGAGLSRPKAAYCRHMAEAVASGRLDLEGLAALDDHAAFEALVAVKGIGRWTAEIYLLFSLDRRDVWPAHDVALQVAVERLKGLEARPTVKQMDAIAEAWRPWRGVAAQILWRYYRVVTGRADPGR